MANEYALNVATNTTLQTTPNYIATEASGSANNALAVNLVQATTRAPIALAAGLRIAILLTHTLQAGANTIAINGGTAKNIKSHLNVANNIASAYAAGSLVDLMYDGTQFQDLSQ